MKACKALENWRHVKNIKIYKKSESAYVKCRHSKNEGTYRHSKNEGT